MRGPPVLRNTKASLDPLMASLIIAPRKVAATATSSATLAKGYHTPVDATSGAKTMTLPSDAPVGVEISVEKVDVSANAVTVSGSLRGVPSTIPLTSQYEARTFLSDGSGSWRPTSDHRTAAALSNTFAKPGGRLKDLPVPWVMPHRSGGAIYPESSVEGLRACIAAGLPTIDIDCWLMADGVVASYHDQTLDRLTTSTGDIQNISTRQFLQLQMDAGAVFGYGWTNDLKPALFSDILQEFGGKVFIQAEAKNGKACVDAMVRLIVQAGLQDSFMVSSQGTIAAATGYLANAVAAGIPTCVYTSGATPDFTAIKAAGVGWWGSDIGVTDAQIAAAKAAGLRLVIGPVQRRYDRDRLVALGVEGFWSDDPVYLQGTYKRTTDPYVMQYPWHGMQTNDNGDRGVFNAPNQWGITSNAAYLHAVLQGWACPIVATTYSLAFTINLQSGAATNYAQLFMCSADDRAWNNNATNALSGYRFDFKPGGQIDVYIIAAGAVTYVTTLAGNAITVPGGTAQIKVDVTPATVKISRVDGGQSYTLNDSAYRGGYFWLGTNVATGWFSGVTVS